MEYLGLNSLRGEVNICLKKSLDDDAFGLCWGDDREIEIWIASSQFGVPISRENKLRTIAHELVHARQYLRRELKGYCDKTNSTRWKGMQYRYKDDESDTPWELEAHKYELIVYDAWLSMR
jgi:hypothetical protein